MALDPLELGVIGVMVVVMFIWGPDKIPEIARALGRARKEFESATKDFQGVAQSLQSPTGPIDSFVAALAGPLSSADKGNATVAATSSSPAPAAGVAAFTPPVLGPGPATVAGAQPPVAGVKTGDQILIETARKLGISTQGKTREQIQDEIITMASRGAPSASATDPSTDSTTNDAPSG